MFFTIAKRKRYLNRFLRYDATSPEKARTLQELGLRESRVLARLRRRAIVFESQPGRFYISPAQAQAFRSRQRTLVLTALAAVILLGLLILIIGSVTR